jgi:hypothetical protein
VTTLCIVEGLEAEYKFTDQDGGTKKCSIVFRSRGRKLDVEKVSSGEGVIYIGYKTKDVDPALITSMSGGHTVQRVWRFDPYLVKGSQANYSTGESSGEILEVTLGETAASKLFPCSGFVRGDLVGVIRAPAVRLTMMGKDLWAFMIYYDNAPSGDNALKFGKSSLSVVHDMSNVTADLRADNADKRKLIVTLNSTGKDFKKLRVNLTRMTPGGDELEEKLGEFSKDDLGPKVVSWTPVNRTGAELLWVFPTSLLGRHGALKDAIEQLGAKVNRSVFADGYGRRQMDDFILADGGKMDYRIKLVMEHHFEIRGPTRGYLLEDSTTMKYVKLNASRKKAMNSHVSTIAVQTQLSNDASADLETRICTRCGSKIVQSARFCSHCEQMQMEQGS